LAVSFVAMRTRDRQNPEIRMPGFENTLIEPIKGGFWVYRF
jgi:hypothetical protein